MWDILNFQITSNSPIFESTNESCEIHCTINAVSVIIKGFELDVSQSAW